MKFVNVYKDFWAIVGFLMEMDAAEGLSHLSGGILCGECAASAEFGGFLVFVVNGFWKCLLAGENGKRGFFEPPGHLPPLIATLATKVLRHPRVS